MKARCPKPAFLLPVLVGALGSVMVGQALGQSFTNLHSFAAVTGSTNAEGADPAAGLVLYTNTLFGTAQQYGSTGSGTIFALNTDGSGFRLVHTFAAVHTNASGVFTNREGAQPAAQLTLSGSTLCGTALSGGPAGNGAIFKVNADGTGFTNLHSFTPLMGGSLTNADGANPAAELVLSGNTCFGTASYGGARGGGTVFAININSTGFTNLHSFSGVADGQTPQAGLMISGNTLFGTTQAGGKNGSGVVFALNTDGTGFTNLHNFTGGSDGGLPGAGLILSGSTLYGTTFNGGQYNYGTVFSMDTNGANFVTLHSFNGTNDGAYPVARLALLADSLYGTTANGGTSGTGLSGSGTIFVLRTNGTGFATLYEFTPLSANTNKDGNTVLAPLSVAGTTLFGTAQAGGKAGAGTVFSLTLPPPRLSIAASSGNILLAWPSSYPGLTLESTPMLSASPSWASVYSQTSSVILNGQFVLTIPNNTTNTVQFYRLSQ